VSTIVTRALATIPELLARAADRDAQRVWLRTDDGSQTFAGAVGLAGALAHRLRDAGVRHGDLVVVTTRTTPAYLLTWLALAALGAATREGLLNSAKHSGATAADLYTEVTPERVSVFVRDRGKGFDPETVPDDRRGLRDSVRGRLTRLGGTAEVRSASGEGTEVELVLPRDAS